MRMRIMPALLPADILKELPSMRRYARSLTRDESAADDIVQDALIKALKRRDTFRPGSSKRGWLLAIVHNVFVSMRRREQAEANRDARFAEEMIDRLEPDQEYSAYLGEVAQAFATLPEHHRAVLHLIAIEGQSYQEAAAILGVPTGTIMSRLSRARAALRRTCGQQTSTYNQLRIVGGQDAD